MRTSAEKEYLKFLGRIVRERSGKTRYTLGGDEQFDADINNADIDAFRTHLKDLVSNAVIDLIKERFPRLADVRYQVKHHEALVYKYAGYPSDTTDFNLLAQEAEERGITPRQTANQIINAVNGYNDRIARIERRRVQFNAAVDAATTLEQLYTMKEAAITAIKRI